MPASLSSWLERIGVEHPRGVERGLAHVQEVATRLGVLPPADTVVVVAGTNGKGSTTAFAEQLLLAAGRSVGTNTSPHVHRFNERIRLNGADADDAVIVDALEAIERARGDVELSYFEYATLAALVAIRRAEVEFAVLEVGLGGRLDAVNVVDADVAVVTSIGLDHQEYLGDTRELIGAEKAGVLRLARPVVVGDREPPASVLDRAASLSAPVLRAGRDFGAHGDALWLVEQGRQVRFAYDREYTVHAANAATALQAVRATGVGLDEGQVRRAARRVRNLGRCEVVETGGRTWVLDVAHNPEGARFLAAQLRERFGDQRIDAVVGCLADKDAAGIVAALRARVTSFAFADTGTVRGRSGAAVRCAAAEPHAFAGSLEACMAQLQSATTSSPPPHGNGVMLICGSFDLVERARHRLDLSTKAA